MRVLRFLLICLGSVQLAHADVPLADFVVNGLDTPLRLRLVVTRNGEAWTDYFQSSHERHVDELFHQLDGDGDGRLTAQEAMRMPAPGAFIDRASESDVHVAFNFRVLDADGDGGATRQELAEYVGGFTRIPLQLRIDAESTRRGSGNLFDVLDNNRDGKLTPEEWSNSQSLRNRDRDGNRVLTSDEMTPPTAALFGPEFIAAPWSGSEKVVLTYRIETPSQTPADAIIVVRYLDAETHDEPATVSATLTDAGAQRGLNLVKSRWSGIILEFEYRRIEFGLIPAAFRRSEQLRRAILREYDALTVNAQGEVAKTSELPAHVKKIFSLADKNGNSGLTRQELVECLDRVVAAESSSQAARLRLTVFPEQSGLMSLIDTNLDGRLSLREVSLLQALLSELAGEDGTFKRDGFPSTLRILLQRGPLTESSGPELMLDSGPPWFFRADRNRDGDLDELEFLGSAELFRQFDRNGDGWIDLPEAIAADHKMNAHISTEVVP